MEPSISQDVTTPGVTISDLTDMSKCDKCKKWWPGQKLSRCNTCFTKTCLRCQCESVGGLHNHIHDCFTFPNNPAIALAPLTNPSLAEVSPRLGLLQPIAKPFTALEEQTWVHNRPGEDTFRLFIDSYRLRLHDSFLFEGETKSGTIYSGCADSKAGFRRYLHAASRNGLMPDWWGTEGNRRCRAFGMADFQFHSLKKHLTQAMVVDYYKDATFPTQLRLFAEDVLGRGTTCLRSCRGVLDALVNMEAFERGGTTTFDWNAYNTAYANQDWERGEVWPI